MPDSSEIDPERLAGAGRPSACDRRAPRHRRTGAGISGGWRDPRPAARVDDGPDLDVAIEGEVDALSDVPGFEPEREGLFLTGRLELDGIKVDVARARAESYPTTRRPAGGTPGDHRRRTSHAATSRSTRWPSRSPEIGGADRPARRCRRPAGGPPAGAARALLHRRSHPGAAGGALRRAARLRARARHGEAARADRSIDRLGGPHPGRAAPDRRRGRSGSRAAADRRLGRDAGPRPGRARPGGRGDASRLRVPLVRLGGPGAGRDARHHEAAAPDPRARRRDPRAAVGDRPPGRTPGIRHSCWWPARSARNGSTAMPTSSGWCGSRSPART